MNDDKIIKHRKLSKNKTTTKIILSALLIAVLPSATYKLSTSYITTYDKTSDYIMLLRNKALNYFNLQMINSTNSIDYLIKEHAYFYKLNPDLIKSIIMQESAYDASAYSSAGAIGLMQIMPENTKRCGLNKVYELWNESNNIKCGCQIIAEELKVYNGNLHKALQVYNGGTKKLGISPVIKYANEVINKFAQLTYSKI